MRLLIPCLLLALAALSAPARADDIYTFVVKKQEDKQKYNWWLTDWLEKRDKIRLMDLWFALHSPSPYEFFVGGAYIGGSADPGGAYSATDLYFGAFNRIFGLEGRRDSSLGIRYSGIFDLRAFGYSDQGTNITLQGGVRSQDIGGSSTRSALAGGKITLYFARPFGVNFLYRHFFESTPNGSGQRVSGKRLEGGAFLEFGLLRLYGDYFSEPETRAVATAGTSTEISKTGFELGARIYF